MRHYFQRGFTLIEIAIVLVIIAVLLGGLLVPFASSVDNARRKRAERQMQEEIIPALMAFAASRTTGTAYLPCPDCRDNGSNCPGGGANPGDGFEDRQNDGSCSVTWGVLPWATLQVGNSDPWGSQYSYRVHDPYADNQGRGIELNNAFVPNSDIVIETADNDGNGVRDPLAGATNNGVPLVIVSHGANQFGAMAFNRDENGNGIQIAAPDVTANVDEFENFDGGDQFVMRPPSEADGADVQEFDDIVVWLSNYRLRAFLAEVGVVP